MRWSPVKTRKGAGAVELGILVALIAVVALTAIRTTGNTIKEVLASSSGGLTDVVADLDCKTDCFVTTWDTSQAGGTGDRSLELPLAPWGSYDAMVYWGDGTASRITGVSGPEDRTHTYSSPGTYTVRISGRLDGVSFQGPDGSEDEAKLLEISDWGTSRIAGGSSQFADTVNLSLTASGPADLSLVTYAGAMFQNSGITGGVENWDVSGIEEAWSMFAGADSFNADLSGWDVSGMRDTSSMFANATAFNGDLSGWDVSGIESMNYMFNGAESFNGDISGWDVSSVTQMTGMMGYTFNFDHDLSAWCVAQFAERPDGFVAGLESDTNPNWIKDNPSWEPDWGQPCN